MLSFKEFSAFCVGVTDFIADNFPYPSLEFNYTYKSDGTEVTDTDLYIEDRIRKVIKEKFPEHGILGEERESYNDVAKIKWIIDPIDGTFGYTKSVPLFGTLIGLLKNDEPLYGFMRLPLIGDTWISGDGSVALHDGKPIAPTPHQSWKKSLILTTDQQTIEKSPINSYWQSALKYGASARTWGDCFGYYLVCIGKAELMADTNLKPFDILPLIPILQGAGLEVHNVECSNFENILACKSGVFEQLK